MNGSCGRHAQVAWPIRPPVAVHRLGPCCGQGFCDTNGRRDARPLSRAAACSTEVAGTSSGLWSVQGWRDGFRRPSSAGWHRWKTALSIDPARLLTALPNESGPTDERPNGPRTRGQINGKRSHYRIRCHVRLVTSLVIGTLRNQIVRNRLMVGVTRVEGVQNSIEDGRFRRLNVAGSEGISISYEAIGSRWEREPENARKN